MNNAFHHQGKFIYIALFIHNGNSKCKQLDEQSHSAHSFNAQLT